MVYARIEIEIQLTQTPPGVANDITAEKYDFDVDGRINDGTEMFGTRIGDGFSDLIVQNIDIQIN